MYYVSIDKHDSSPPNEKRTVQKLMLVKTYRNM